MTVANIPCVHYYWLGKTSAYGLHKELHIVIEINVGSDLCVVCALNHNSTLAPALTRSGVVNIICVQFEVHVMHHFFNLLLLRDQWRVIYTNYCMFLIY